MSGEQMTSIEKQGKRMVNQFPLSVFLFEMRGEVVTLLSNQGVNVAKSTRTVCTAIIYENHDEVSLASLA
ncbi:MAG: hypothetical protein WC753_03620 [Candidatus Gracilibacteria bacterium]